jgi:nitrogen regulatory protein PII
VKGFRKEVHLYHKDIQNRIRIELLAKEAEVDKVKNIILSNACCGLEEDGCLSIYNLEEFINFSEYEKG